MNLLEALGRLSELLPERVWWVGDDTARVYVDGGPEYVSLVAPPALLEHALREEIEERGWNWELSRKGRNPDDTWQYWAHIWHPYRGTPEVIQLSDSPAHALALALIAALKTEHDAKNRGEAGVTEGMRAAARNAAKRLSKKADS